MNNQSLFVEIVGVCEGNRNVIQMVCAPLLLRTVKLIIWSQFISGGILVELSERIRSMEISEPECSLDRSHVLPGSEIQGRFWISKFRPSAILNDPSHASPLAYYYYGLYSVSISMAHMAY